MLLGTATSQVPSIENVTVVEAIRLLKLYGPSIHIQFFYDLEELKEEYELESYFWKMFGGLENPGDFEDVLEQLDTIRLLGGELIEVQ